MKNVESSPPTSPVAKPRRPPPMHQATVEESLARLALRHVTTKRMFGGLCYYADGKPFALVLDQALAVKLSARQLRASCGQADGRLFHPGDGEFVMREYLELSPHVLVDEEKVDAYILASYRFIAGQATVEDELAASDLWQGRGDLYQRKNQKTKGKN